MGGGSVKAMRHFLTTRLLTSRLLEQNQRIYDDYHVNDSVLFQYIYVCFSGWET